MSLIKENNQKRTKIVLIVAVAALWLFIFLKIFRLFGGNKEYVVNSVALDTSKESYSVMIDTFKISMNYTDPFRAKMYKSSTKKKPKTAKAINKKKPKAKQPKNCITEVIFYKGTIRDNKSKTVLVKIGSSSHFVAEKENIGNLQVSQVFKDSIIIKKDNCYKTIYRD